MTRFEREISESLGAFWKKNAEEEVKKAVAQADTAATVDIVNIGLHFFLKDVRTMLPPVMNHSIVDA